LETAFALVNPTLGGATTRRAGHGSNQVRRVLGSFYDFRGYWLSFPRRRGSTAQRPIHAGRISVDPDWRRDDRAIISAPGSHLPIHVVQIVTTPPANPFLAPVNPRHHQASPTGD
jgi:hypothetical protein